jgi:hypothetical protein
VTDDPQFQDWIDRAKATDIRSAAERLGARLKKAGAAEYQGPCPKCGGDDRFSINTDKGVFNCRGTEGGGVVAMAIHVLDCNFVAACEFLTNEAPPDSASEYRAPDPEIVRERKEERKDEAADRKKEELSALEKSIHAATVLFERGVPIFGTLVEDYLERRGIVADEEIAADLRMIPHLEYWGFPAPDADGVEDFNSQVLLGEFHCMIAAARNAEGKIQGVHRTYLAPDGSKLRPPGDRRRNKAKKGTFRMGGALIRLFSGDAPGEAMAVAEGIESALAWRALARTGMFGEGWAECPVAAAYSLGNLCGSSAGAIPHPRDSRKTLPGAEPNMASMAAPIPAGVKTLLLLGDADSDPAMTRALLRVGAERYRRLGLEVFIHMASDGMDFDDVLLQQQMVAA